MAQISEEEAQQIVDEVVAEGQAPLSAKLAKKRADLGFKTLKDCPVKASTDDLVADGLSFERCLGKLLMSRILEKLHDRGYPVGELTVPSEALVYPELEDYAPE